MLTCIIFHVTDSHVPPTVDQNLFDDIQHFFWGETDDNLDEEELLKAAIARSLEKDTCPADDVKLKESLEKFQQQVNDLETCDVLILRKRLMQTCLNAVKEECFDFFKVPCIHFSGEDADDLGGPRREFLRLLMSTISNEFGVFEGNQSSLVFSHNHAVLEMKKPFIAGQFLAWSILHNGPGLHAMNEDTYHLMLQLEESINIPRAIAALSDVDTAAIAKELYDAADDDQFLDTKEKHMDWLLDHGITTRNSTKEEMCCQVIKESLYYRYSTTIHFPQQQCAMEK